MAAVHVPSPLGVGTPSSFNARAISRSDAVRSESTRSMMGGIERACAFAFSVRAARALAVSAAVPARLEILPAAFREPCLLPGGLCAGGNHAGLKLGNRLHALQKNAARRPLDLTEVAEAHINASFQDPRQEPVHEHNAFVPSAPPRAKLTALACSTCPPTSSSTG